MNLIVRSIVFITRRRYVGHQCCRLSFAIILGVSVTMFLNLGLEISQIEKILSRSGLFPAHDDSNMKTTTLKTPIYLTPERLKQMMINKKNNNEPSMKNRRAEEMKQSIWMEKIEKLNKLRAKPEVRHVEVEEKVEVNYDVHIFYYTWYESMDVDGHWQHWDHVYLTNWKSEDRRLYRNGKHVPPDDIGSNFYPRLGCYSSRDPVVIDTHMRQIREAGIGVLVVSWYPPGMSDEFSRHHSPDSIFKQILDMAKMHELKVAPHIEPYNNRNPITFSRHLRYFVGAYGDHPALYRMRRRGKEHIVYYIYDSYRTPASNWRQIFDPNGNLSLRGTDLDGIFLGLLVEQDHKSDIKRAKFDGFYTYFASNGFTFGSSWKNWMTLSNFARAQNLIFIPSVGPGYIDTQIRPWNSASTKHRRNGKYYEVAWRAAISAGVRYVSITSFNEWHEGTQIEPAVPKTISNFTYLNYEPEGSDFYLNLTKFWVNEFSKKSPNPLIM